MFRKRGSAPLAVALLVPGPPASNEGIELPNLSCCPLVRPLLHASKAPFLNATNIEHGYIELGPLSDGGKGDMFSVLEVERREREREREKATAFILHA